MAGLLGRIHITLEYYKARADPRSTNGIGQSSEKQFLAARAPAFVTDFNSKKHVYKSSKGFRVILNSIDERKISNIKKLQSPNNFTSGIFNNQTKRGGDGDAQGSGAQRNQSL